MGKGGYRKALTVAFVAIAFFNYANATLFWHCHIIGSASVTHSHIYWKTHTSGDPTGGHTPGQIQIIDVICHAVYTADVIQEILLDRIDVLERELADPVVTEEEWGFAEVLSLRGPPRLV